MNMAKFRSSIQGFDVDEGGTGVTHLLIPNDTLFFLNCGRAQVQLPKNILMVSGVSSGMKVNS